MEAGCAAAERRDAPSTDGTAEGRAAARRHYVTTAAGRRLAYIEGGAGPPLVLIHGALMTADDPWIGLGPSLSASFRCFAFDRPGHGWSDHVRGADASLWAQAETLRGAVQALGLHRPVVCGHSLGAAVGLAYAMAHPEEVAGVVALAPICFPEPRLEQVLFGPRAAAVTGAALSRVLGATADPLVLPALWRGMFLPERMPESFASGFPFAVAGAAGALVAEAESALSYWPDLARSALGYASCRAPAAILCGGSDLVTNPYTQGAAAAALMPGARLTLLPGVGHMLHHARPDDVLRAALAIG